MAHLYALAVVASDLDELGHVNNARYLDYLERGRTTWYAVDGLIEACISDANPPALGTVVVNVNIDFRSECARGDNLTVSTAAERVGRKSFTVRQQIHKADGTLAAEASVTSVVMDLNSRSAITLPPPARKKLQP
jgi:thioesterase III